MASTIGNGSPSAHADTPATVAATSEIATLPRSEEETAPIESSTTGCQRRSTAGGAKPKSHSVIVGRSMSRKSDRKVRVTIESTEPNTPAAMPRSAEAASGSPAARSFSGLPDLVVDVRRRHDVLEGRLAGELIPVGGQLVHELDDLLPHRARGDQDDREHDDEQRGEDGQRRPAAAPPPSDHGADDRVETEGEHGRHEDREQRAEREHRERDEQGEAQQHEQRAHGHDDLDALRRAVHLPATLTGSADGSLTRRRVNRRRGRRAGRMRAARSTRQRSD